MSEKGFRKAFALKGGWDLWNEKNFPVVEKQ
jgi:hypothetical protein